MNHDKHLQAQRAYECADGRENEIQPMAYGEVHDTLMLTDKAYRKNFEAWEKRQYEGMCNTYSRGEKWHETDRHKALIPEPRNELLRGFLAVVLVTLIVMGVWWL